VIRQHLVIGPLHLFAVWQIHFLPVIVNHKQNNDSSFPMLLMQIRRTSVRNLLPTNDHAIARVDDPIRFPICVLGTFH
jgi:hypothetical protein